VPAAKKLDVMLTTVSVIGLAAVTAGLAFGVGLVPLDTAIASPDRGPEGTLGVGERTVAPYQGPESADDKVAVEALGDATKPMLTAVARKAAPVPAARTAARPARSASSRGATGGWSSARASWYGPGFYGRKTASGATLTQGMMNVAHRSMAFGTRIQFEYRGRTCVAVVNDRGPYVGGRLFDLGPGTAAALGFGGVGTVRYRVLGR